MRSSFSSSVRLSLSRFSIKVVRRSPAPPPLPVRSVERGLSPYICCSSSAMRSSRYCFSLIIDRMLFSSSITTQASPFVSFCPFRICRVPCTLRVRILSVLRSQECRYTSRCLRLPPVCTYILRTPPSDSELLLFISYGLARFEACLVFFMSFKERTRSFEECIVEDGTITVLVCKAFAPPLSASREVTPCSCHCLPPRPFLHRNSNNNAIRRYYRRK